MRYAGCVIRTIHLQVTSGRSTEVNVTMPFQMFRQVNAFAVVAVNINGGWMAGPTPYKSHTFRSPCASEVPSSMNGLESQHALRHDDGS